MRLSIRWRLTLWNVLALAVVLLGFGALVYGLLARTLYYRIDHALLTEFQELEEKPPRDLDYWITEAEEHEKIYCVIYDADGKPTGHRTGELAPTSIPAAPAAGDGPHLYSEQVPIIGRQRIVSGRVRLNGEHCTVLLMTSLEDTDRELGELLAVLIPATPVALAVAGCLAYLLAHKALAPMEQLRRRTEEITADRLDRRLPNGRSNDELSRLARTINAMIGRLERSFREIRRFTADASHELRTPLTAIRAEAEVALGKPLSIEEHQHLLGSILEECDRLTRLTDQLLALSREDAGVAPQVREPVDLAALLAEVVETMGPLAEVKGLRFHLDGQGPVWICGDEARLRQVHYNLLDNAIKYTPEGGSVEVRLQQEDRAAVVTVRDSGIGIPPEHLTSVFERFFRVDKARGRAEGGTGLGLSIARSIVVAHGGQIQLVSTLGKGTTFTVTLPRDAPA